jgi:hypothetical protein
MILPVPTDAASLSGHSQVPSIKAGVALHAAGIPLTAPLHQPFSEAFP